MLDCTFRTLTWKPEAGINFWVMKSLSFLPTDQKLMPTFNIVGEKGIDSFVREKGLSISLGIYFFLFIFCIRSLLYFMIVQPYVLQFVVRPNVFLWRGDGGIEARSNKKQEFGVSKRILFGVYSHGEGEDGNQTI